MLKLVWDTSAIVNIKEPDSSGYSPGYSLWKDLADGRIKGPYLNIVPAISTFETAAVVSNKNRRGANMLHEFWIFGENEMLYPIDKQLIDKSIEIARGPGFDHLYGADLIFGCIAKIEDAWLITLDKNFKRIKEHVKVIDLNDSRISAKYREHFPMIEADV